MTQPKFVLCVRYNARIALENERLQAFVMHTNSCSSCGEKVMLSGATRDLLGADPEIKPLCQVCTSDYVAEIGQPQLSMTSGQLREVASLLAKRQATDN